MSLEKKSQAQFQDKHDKKNDKQNMKISLSKSKESEASSSDGKFYLDFIQFKNTLFYFYQIIRHEIAEKKDTQDANVKSAQQEEFAESENEDEDESFDTQYQNLMEAQDKEKPELKSLIESKQEMIQTQDQEALEQLIEEYGEDLVCFTYISGYSSRKSYNTHKKQTHPAEAKQLNLGKFLCSRCNSLYATKRNLLRQVRTHYNDAKSKNTLTMRQQKLVNSYQSQKQLKSKVMKAYLEKKLKKN